MFKFCDQSISVYEFVALFSNNKSSATRSKGINYDLLNYAFCLYCFLTHLHYSYTVFMTLELFIYLFKQFYTLLLKPGKRRRKLEGDASSCKTLNINEYRQCVNLSFCTKG